MSERLILVTGAGGFVGRHLCAALRRDGWRIRAAVREPRANLVADDVVQVGSISAATDWDRALRDVTAVIHLAARVHVLRDTSGNADWAFDVVNVAGTVRLAQQAARHGVPLTFLSSIGVLGDRTTDRPFSEPDPLNPRTPYTRSKAKAESALKEGKLGNAITIVRAPLIYGPDAPGNFARLVRLVRSGMPLPLGAVQNARTLVSMENLVSLLVRVLRVPATGVRVLHAADAESCSTPELVRILAEGLGLPSRLVRVPVSLLRAAGRLSGRLREVQQLTESLEVNSDATCLSLEWSPPLAVREALLRSVRGTAATPRSSSA